MVPRRNGKAGHFGVDFARFWAKNGTKMPEKGPKSGSFGYSSVNYVF
jgi:hypothetical protein